MNTAMIGKTISHYRIVVEPGGSGMGDVYQARERFHPRRPLARRLEFKVHKRIFFRIRIKPSSL
jgi:hypothetical protein